MSAAEARRSMPDNEEALEFHQAHGKMKRNILITGHPRVGKTTLIRRLVKELKDFKLQGFYSQEILEKGRRQGFRLVSLDGASYVFARRGAAVEARLRVGAYGVFPQILEEATASALTWDPLSPPDLVIIDEIAKMEMLATGFRQRVAECLQGPVPVLATVALRGTGLIRRVKDDKAATLYRLTLKNRAALPGQIRRDLAEILGPPAATSSAKPQGRDKKKGSEQRLLKKRRSVDLGKKKSRL